MPCTICFDQVDVAGLDGINLSAFVPTSYKFTSFIIYGIVIILNVYLQILISDIVV